MFDDYLDQSAAVTDVIVLKIFDVCGVDGFAYNFVDDDSIDGYCFQYSWQARAWFAMMLA